MEEIANLVSIKVSPLFIGVGFIIVIALGITIYMKKRNANHS
ncbi:MAG: hypothetical protein E6248_11365 [Clostridium sp.]|nr:hypothetical protein [Clostridium sp.]MDU5111039.1 hypothetical protein [Clostridium sp.]